MYEQKCFEDQREDDCTGDYSRVEFVNLDVMFDLALIFHLPPQSRAFRIMDHWRRPLLPLAGMLAAAGDVLAVGAAAGAAGYARAGAPLEAPLEEGVEGDAPSASDPL